MSVNLANRILSASAYGTSPIRAKEKVSPARALRRREGDRGDQGKDPCRRRDRPYNAACVTDQFQWGLRGVRSSFSGSGSAIHEMHAPATVRGLLRTQSDANGVEGRVQVCSPSNPSAAQFFEKQVFQRRLLSR